MKQDFPQMIYHIAEKPRIVKTKEELAQYEALGWSKTPDQSNRVDYINKKLKYHRDEINVLCKELDSLMAKENESKPKEIKPVEEVNTSAPVPKKRGPKPKR